MPTIRDVARRAGVSPATVSRVLNDRPIVTGGTRDRVHRAIADLGYRPSSMARSLSLGRAHSVGIVAPFFTSPSVVERVRGVADCLALVDYDLKLFDVETPAQRVGALRDFAGRDRVDGLLVISLPLSDEEATSLEADRFPVVLVDAAHPSFPSVAIDDMLGGRMATEYLLAKGHRRIGFVGDLPVNPFGFTSSEERRAGYRQALEAADVVASARLERRGPHGRDEARAMAASLLSHDPPTAIFAASDVQAIGVLRAARSLGLRVPDDIAVMGFDDIEIAEDLGLTTVRQPLRESGLRGVDLLLGAIEGRERRPVEPLEDLQVVERLTA